MISFLNRHLSNILVTFTLLSLVIFSPLPASAITFGTVDTEHTNVGVIIRLRPDGSVGLFCSGSLVSDMVFLTAGHCTDSLEGRGIPPEQLRVSFAVRPLENPRSWRQVDSYMSHSELSFLTNDWHDLGVLILDKPVRGVTPVTLAPMGYLDMLREQGVLRDAIFINVGYGRDENLEPTGERRISFSGFNALLDSWLYMSQNNALDFGGTCFGDSGGPTFHSDGTTELLVAITSWGDAVCVATNNNYRVDIASSQDFINSMIASTT